MARYKRDHEGVWRDPNGNPMVMPERDGISLPTLMPDIGEYASPIDGKLISSRSARREDLKANDCVEWEPSMSPTRGKLELNNPRFAKKHGLENFLSEEHKQ